MTFTEGDFQDLKWWLGVLEAAESFWEMSIEKETDSQKRTLWLEKREEVRQVQKKYSKAVLGLAKAKKDQEKT